MHCLRNGSKMLQKTLVTLAITASFTPLVRPLVAQQLAEGYGVTTTILPAGSSNVLTTNTGRVSFDGFQLSYAQQGSAPQALLTFGSYTFGSFTIAIGTTHVLFGESSTGGIWSIPLNGQPPQQIAIVPLNYDAVMLDDDRALVSAKTGGFSAADNDVMFVDLLTGQTQLLAQFPGASGPLAVDAVGHVYYATSPSAFPAPTGTVTLLRLPQATIDNAIATNTVLSAANAQVVLAGLDAAGDLAFDDDGDLFFVDWLNNRIGEIHRANGMSASLAPTLIDYAASGLYGSVLQFRRTIAGPQIFAPMQPIGGELLVHETDYVSISQLRSVVAQRPTISPSVAAPIPAGTFAFNTTNGPSQGIGLLAFQTAIAAGPITVSVPGFEQPLFLDASLLSNPVLVPITFDAQGQASLSINNPGFAPAIDTTTQCICLSLSGAIGSTEALAVRVGQ